MREGSSLFDLKIVFSEYRRPFKLEFQINNDTNF